MIEVLKTEENLSEKAQFDTDTPAIQKSYFKEVFDNYNHLLKCEAELTASDDQQELVVVPNNKNIVSNKGEIEAAEKEEKAFMEEQRTSSKSNTQANNS